LTLIKLTEYESTRADAEGGLKILMETRIAPSAWDSTIRDMISNRKHAIVLSLTSNTESQHASTAAQGLQHLAELATANEEGRDVSMGEGRNEGETFAAKSGAAHSQVHQDLRDIVKNGYLRLLSGDSAR
jgi:beta-lactamase class A